MRKCYIILMLMQLLRITGFSQDTGRLSGNFQLDVQAYQGDSLIGAAVPREKMGMNSYANFRYDRENFSAGVRFESYLNALQGFDPGYDGTGIPYAFARYHTESLDLTVGDYYEQFGTGILLRSWEDQSLGVDNALRGVRVKYTLRKSLELTGVVGKQRNRWERGPGLIRGLDANLFVNDLISAWSKKSTRVNLGSSFVSKYQADDDPIYVLPENVGAWSSRIQISGGGFWMETEYARKINDPSADNNFIYKPGNAWMINGSYATSGLGISFSAKRVDNMSFRSDRNESLNWLMIAYLPPISKNYTYSLMNIYPYASQANGEMGVQGEITYRLRRDTKMGGTYGTQLTASFSIVNSIDKQAIDASTPIGEPGTLGYTSDFFKPGEERYYRDVNLEISRKLNRQWKITGIAQYLSYNQLVLEGKGGMVHAQVAVLDITWKPQSRRAWRLETQGLWTRDDQGHWAMALLEYTVSPHWFFSLVDQYNYGHPVTSQRVHYLSGTVGYVHNASRFQISYGKQREGILCVGGVCRNVPAMSGVTLSVSSSF